MFLHPFSDLAWPAFFQPKNGFLRESRKQFKSPKKWSYQDFCYRFLLQWDQIFLFLKSCRPGLVIFNFTYLQYPFLYFKRTLHISPVTYIFDYFQGYLFWEGIFFPDVSVLTLSVVFCFPYFDQLLLSLSLKHMQYSK